MGNALYVRQVFTNPLVMRREETGWFRYNDTGGYNNTVTLRQSCEAFFVVKPPRWGRKPRLNYHAGKCSVPAGDWMLARRIIDRARSSANSGTVINIKLANTKLIALNLAVRPFSFELLHKRFDRANWLTRHQVFVVFHLHGRGDPQEEKRELAHNFRGLLKRAVKSWQDAENAHVKLARAVDQDRREHPWSYMHERAFPATYCP